MTRSPAAPEQGRPTVGHHFGSLLQCRQKAWHDHHSDPGLKSEATAYLRALQREGFLHERQVSSSLYPDAVKIPERGDPLSRASETIRAMRDGAGAILQAYFHSAGAVGVADVLELVGADDRSLTGHVYRIGEFKRATALSTGHVMQVAWYNELLTGVQGIESDEAFFILGDGTRTSICLAGIRVAYEACKADLLLLREAGVRPGPHLCRWCSTCQWRGLCVPQLVQQGHVSLLPGFSPRHAEALGHSGIDTWGRVGELPDATLLGLGFDDHEIGRLRDSCRRLRRGEVVLRHSIKSEELRRFRAVSLAYGGEGTDDGRGARPVPSAIWFESGGMPLELPVVHDQEVMGQAVSPLIGDTGLAFYGATDLIGFLKLLPPGLRDGARCVDLLDLIERVVHAPLPGLELADVVGFASREIPGPRTRPGRLAEIRVVIDWLTGAGECSP